MGRRTGSLLVGSLRGTFEAFLARLKDSWLAPRSRYLPSRSHCKRAALQGIGEGIMVETMGALVCLGGPAMMPMLR